MASSQPKAITTIREFAPGDDVHFRVLNEEWINRYFTMEAKDLEALTDPQGSILAGGGRIFLADVDGRTVGCCALIAMPDGVYEVAKMAVTEAARGLGLGRQLLNHVIAEARALGAKKLVLGSNRKLAVALRLYESIGFQHLPPERIPHSEYARADVFMELPLS